MLGHNYPLYIYREQGADIPRDLLRATARARRACRAGDRRHTDTHTQHDPPARKKAASQPKKKNETKSHHRLGASGIALFGLMGSSDSLHSSGLSQ